jgi:hypothetical protein
MSENVTSSAPAAPVPPGLPAAAPTAADAAAVDAMLAAAGLTVAADERERLLEMYAIYRPGIAALYDLPEVRYEAPALVFQAEPKLQAWGA